jgi:hypothetical protein
LKFHDILNEVVTDFLNVSIEEIRNDGDHFLEYKQFAFKVFGGVFVTTDDLGLDLLVVVFRIYNLLAEVEKFVL